jgi:hypothetical protein
MPLGFCDQELAILPKERTDLPKKPMAIGHLMEHPERERKVERSGQTEIIGSAPVEFYPLLETTPLGAPASSAKHLRLDVNGDYAASRTDDLREGQREIPEPAPKIYDHVST